MTHRHPERQRRISLDDWIRGLFAGLVLIGLMAAAEGRPDFGFSILDFGLDEHGHEPRLVSEAEIPTDANIWAACCDHRDCMEAKIDVAFQGGDFAQVAQVKIDAYPIFELETQKIFRSTNGKSYFCRSDLSKPPDRENTRCVFYGRPSYVRR